MLSSNHETSNDHYQRRGALSFKWSGANVIKLFTAVIYCCSTVISSFCVVKWYYYGDYCWMLVSNTMVIYHGILTLEKEGTAVNYHGIFITLAKNTTVFYP